MADRRGPRDGGRAEPVPNAVERSVEGTSAAPIERQRELDDVVVVEIADCDPDQGEASTLDQGYGHMQQRAYRREDRLGVRGRARQRVRARRAREVVEAQSEHDRSAGSPGRPHPAGDAVDEGGDDSVDLVGRSPGTTERALRPD